MIWDYDQADSVVRYLIEARIPFLHILYPRYVWVSVPREYHAVVKSYFYD